MFSVTSAASSRALLTLAEIKTALGVTTSDDDVRLTTLGLQVSDMISLACGVPADGVTPPTLFKETISETVRLSAPANSIVLSRRFIYSMTSVVVGDTTLTTSEYEVDKSVGILRYLTSTGAYVQWPSGKTVVTYVAGFATAPEPLKLAATTLVREGYSGLDRDPLVRGETFEGLGSIQYFQSALAGSTGLPKAVEELLAPYQYGRI